MNKVFFLLMTSLLSTLAFADAGDFVGVYETKAEVISGSACPKYVIVGRSYERIWSPYLCSPNNTTRFADELADTAISVWASEEIPSATTPDYHSCNDWQKTQFGILSEANRIGRFQRQDSCQTQITGKLGIGVPTDWRQGCLEEGNSDKFIGNVVQGAIFSKSSRLKVEIAPGANGEYQLTIQQKGESDWNRQCLLNRLSN